MHTISSISMWSTNFLENLFFPSTIVEWNELDSNIRSSKSRNIFKLEILKFIRPTANNIFDCHNTIGVKLLTRLLDFQNTLNSLCSCRKDSETSFCFLLLCPKFSDEGLTLLSKNRNIIPNILENTNFQIT